MHGERGISQRDIRKEFSLEAPNLYSISIIDGMGILL